VTPLAELAQAHGIALRFHDIWGNEHEVEDATLRALLASMEVAASDDASTRASLDALRDARRSSPLPALVVLSLARKPWRIPLHAASGDRTITARFELEDGRLVEHNAAPAHGDKAGCAEIALDATLPLGYHRLTLLSGDDAVAHTVCAVAPASCHRPGSLRNGGRAFGIAAQLYAVRSPRNWGIGDYGDLAELADRFGRQGAGIVGVNPLHALFPHDPARASPYSPSSRLFANTLYLDVEAIDDYAHSEPARRLVQSSAFAQRLASLRATTLVDYAGVAAAKREALALVHATFRARCARDRAHAAAFEAFKRTGGEALHRHALFEALQEHLHAADPSTWGWPAWPERFHDPRSADVARFAAEHAERVDYYAWLQWQADLQRASAASRAAAAGMAVGLYTDLAVSIDRGGAESWSCRHLYANGASVGAPPDAFSPGGQDWGLPPLIPSRLVDDGYGTFLATLRANMRHAGALRIDHVMGLMRLFWVPAGGKPAQGAYVAYPFDDLLALAALESVRHRCLVIGEDLGTVPDEVRSALQAHDILSYRVLLFERDASRDFKAPASYPEAALATASTHDLPTLAGWWEGRDIDARASLGLIGHADRDRQHWERGEDRARLVAALDRAHLLPDGGNADAEMTPALAAAIVAFLAATPCTLAVFQLDDLVGVHEQANLPGTTDQHPNWRRKLPVDLDDALRDPGMASLLARLRALRPPSTDAPVR